MKVCFTVVGQALTSQDLVLWNKVLACDSAHSWQLYGAAPLGHQVTSTMTWYHTQSHYPDTEITSPRPTLINNAERQARERQVSILKPLVWLDQGLSLQGPDLTLRGSGSPISQIGGWTLYSFGHPDWLGLNKRSEWVNGWGSAGSSDGWCCQLVNWWRNVVVREWVHEIVTKWGSEVMNNKVK